MRRHQQAQDETGSQRRQHRTLPARHNMMGGKLRRFARKAENGAVGQHGPEAFGDGGQQGALRNAADAVMAQIGAEPGAIFRAVIGGDRIIANRHEQARQIEARNIRAAIFHHAPMRRRSAQRKQPAISYTVMSKRGGDAERTKLELCNATLCARNMRVRFTMIARVRRYNVNGRSQ